MVCHGQFHRKFLQPLSAGQPLCPAGAQYKGPSPSDAMAKAAQRPTCSGAYAPESAGCVSSGPDLALGALHVTGDNLHVHCFFVVIIVASYTGSVGPAIYSTSLGVIKSLDTLKYGGKVTVGVVGPRWDPDAKEPAHGARCTKRYRSLSLPPPRKLAGSAGSVGMALPAAAKNRE